MLNDHPKVPVYGAMTFGVVIATSFAVVSPAFAAEKECYKYDTHGRLIEVKRIDASESCSAPSSEIKTEYTYDDADNRTKKEITGAPP